ncbi:MFS transporter permease [Paramagnetospirillum kuznetsovii]|uniref:MFS transporter permease n=1 Tax=Paramagnetospirillum kuznetsovii TaxID=2053833 RepID=A0A364NYX7_9PROT|nr:MFS transporter [Paramagnetospirillum kuznetsovii]RAU22279.1 MFS transporter permease [Paramagnetospirillum kuznetsovii]
MTLDHTRPLFIRLLLLAFIVLVPPVGLLAHGALGEFARGLVPEMDKKAETVGRDLASSIERAIGYGIPLDKLQGMDEFFAPVLAANREIRYLAVTDRDNRILFINGAMPELLTPYFSVTDFEGGGSRKSLIGDFVNLAQPLMSKGVVVGHVQVGLDQDYVQSRLMEIAVDIGVMTLCSLLVSVEILLFIVTFNVIGPIRAVSTVMDRVRRGDFGYTCGVISDDEVGRFVHGFNGAIRHVDGLFRRLEAYMDEIKTAHFDKTVVGRVMDIEARVRFLFRFSRTGQPEVINEHQATDIRLPLFLFVFAEEMSRSFMPLFIRDLYTPSTGLDQEMAIALPIAVFMFFIAAVSPSAAMISARKGSRRVFLIGLLPATVGFFMSGLADNVFDLTLWRSLTAIGYALVTMACQSYIAQAAQRESRAQGLGVYVGAVLTASICGTGIGGVLAERVGYRATFVLAAALSVVAGLLIYRLMDAAQPKAEPLSPRKREFLALLRNWRFFALVTFAAIPSKIALTGFFFFLVPLTLLQTPGYDLGDIARIMMMYPISVVLLSPLAARLADKMGWKAGLVAVGGLIGGFGLLLPVLSGDFNVLGVSIALLGVSHGLSASPQLAIIPDICWTECRNMGQTNVLAFLRLAERVGSVIGPFLAAAFIPIYGISGAVIALGAVVLGMSVVFALLSFAYGSGPHIEAELAE